MKADAMQHETSRVAIPGGWISWSAVGVLTALAWTLTARQAIASGNGPGTMGMAFPAFLAMWVAMMVAMMLPSVAPTAMLWVRARHVTGLRAVSFVAGYLIAWALYGVAAYAVLLGAGRLTERAPEAATWVGAAVLAAAGIYQLTPLKQRCLKHCRSPVGSLLHYGGYEGATADLRVGLHHGLYCVGCCWALMAILVVVGVMNIAVMALLALVVLAEKVWRGGETVARVAGFALLVAAVLAPFYPWLLPGLRVTPMPMM
jgi:predicted metal-binding membrane protein